MIDLTGIISISGQPGLFKVVAQSKNGIIVENLTDKKRVAISSTAKVSSLEDISMFTTGEDKPVREIMKSIFDKEKGGATSVTAKSDDKAVAAYFEAILPEYDKERVYTSNMRKLFNWYNTLQTTGSLKVAEVEKKDDSTDKEAKQAAPKKAAVKKTAVAKDTAKAKAKTSVGVKKTTGVRKTGTA